MSIGEGPWLRLGYTWTKLHLQWMGVVAKAPRRGAHRRKRERRPLPGMMLHQDGSRHAWLEGQPPLDLIVTMDDATGAIYSAFLVEEEGTASTFRALKEVFGKRGLPMSLYTDRGAHYFRTPKPAARSTAAIRPRSGGRWSNWELSTSGPSRPRPGAVRSGRSERFRTGCRRSSSSPGSPGSRRPTLISATSICPPITNASRSRRPARAQPSPPFPASTSTRFCACRRNGRSETTIACPTAP